MWQRDGGVQTLLINDIICNGLVEQDREEEAQMHNDEPVFWMRHTCGRPLKMRVNRFAPAASSGKNA